MTYTTFRNPCTEHRADIIVLASFIEAREFAHEHPAMIETELEAESHNEAFAMTYEDYLAARDEYLEALYGNPY